MSIGALIQCLAAAFVAALIAGISFELAKPAGLAIAGFVGLLSVIMAISYASDEVLQRIKKIEKTLGIKDDE